MQKNEHKPGYKKTKVGWIPEDWECLPFTDVFDRVVVPLAPIETETYQEIGVRSHGKGIFHKEPVTGADIGSKRVFHCQPGALVFNIVFAWEQAVAVLSEQECGLIASHRFPMYKGKEGQAFEPFFLSFFKTRKGKNGLGIASPGGAGRNKTLGQKDMEYLYVPKPTRSEQVTIAGVLQCWDKGIKNLELKIVTKRNIKKGLMQALLSGKIRLPGFGTTEDTEEHGKGRDGIPEGWKEVRFGEIFSFLKTYAPSRAQLTTDSAKSCGIYNIHYGDLHATYDGCMLDCDKEKRIPLLRDSTELPPSVVLLEEGDVVIADVSEDYEGVGACVELRSVGSKKITGGLHTFAVRDAASKTAKGYRGYLLKEAAVSRELKRIATGVSVHGISKTNLAEVKIALPCLEEQQAIAAVISAADTEVETLERKLAVLKDQKRFLLNNLVTGSLRLPEFRIENGE